MPEPTISDAETNTAARALRMDWTPSVEVAELQPRGSPPTPPAPVRLLRFALFLAASGRQHGACDQVGPEAGEDRQVEESRGRHHRCVLLLAERRARDEAEADRRDRTRSPRPAEDPVVAVV